MQTTNLFNANNVLHHYANFLQTETEAQRTRFINNLTTQLRNTRTNSKKYLALNDAINKFYAACVLANLEK
jgi:type III secretory pathway component EscR